MTHFNHGWTDDTVAVPQAVGDRYYAQDLNDDFNYLKHLPYEAILQGRTKDMIISPTSVWDANSHSLTFSGGFGIVALDTQVLDVNEDFTIPPKTTSASRFERITFANATLILPNDGSAHYIVATPTKRSLLQRGKALLAESYACRIKYDGIITIQDTAPTTNQILIGLCYDDEYLLCKSHIFNQSTDTIKLREWYGKNKISQSLVTSLQTYYDTNASTVEVENITIDVSSSNLTIIDNGAFNNCVINIIRTGTSTLKYTIHNSTFRNCKFKTNNSNSDMLVDQCEFYQCEFFREKFDGDMTVHWNEINIVSPKTVYFEKCYIHSIDCDSNNAQFEYCLFDNALMEIDGGIFSNCMFKSVLAAHDDMIYGGTFNDCIITADGSSDDDEVDFNGGVFNNCIIEIAELTNEGTGIGTDATFNNCDITIKKVASSAYGIFGGIFNSCSITMSNITGTSIANSASIKMYFTRAVLPSVPTLSSVGGKLFVVNDTRIL